MKVHLIAALGAVIPFHLCAHVCPVKDGSGKRAFKNTHTGAIAATAAAARGGASGQFLETHDEPIIITDGSVNVNLGYKAGQEGGLYTRHACPGPHVVEITKWNWDPLRRAAAASVTNVKLNDPGDAAATNTLRMWAEPASGTVQPNQPPAITLTLDESSLLWKLSHSRLLSPAPGAGRLHSATHRASWIQVGNAHPMPLRATCYSVQVYHAWAVAGDGSDAQRKAVEPPPCVANIRWPVIDRSQGGPARPGALK